MIIALVAGLVMVAVPLYLWRRPKSDALDGKKPASSADGANGTPGMTPLTAASGGATPAAPEPTPRGVTVGEPKIAKCKKTGAKTLPEQCDRQPFFEEALVKAVRDNASCAPMLPSGGTINFVLDVDFKTKKTKVWSGKSGTVKKKAAKEVLGCVGRSIPTPDWTQVPHQHTKYSITLMASYPPSGGAGGPLAPWAGAPRSVDRWPSCSVPRRRSQRAGGVTIRRAGPRPRR